MKVYGSYSRIDFIKGLPSEFQEVAACLSAENIERLDKAIDTYRCRISKQTRDTYRDDWRNTG